MAQPAVARWISGGQSGVDRAVLDVAVAVGAPYGGWCPAGGWAEDLPNPPGLVARYPGLRPTPARDPARRTAWNVRDSDALLVITRARVSSRGTSAALAEAERLGRPTRLAAVDPSAPHPELAGYLRRWLGDLADGAARPVAVNVAGPRESEWPGAYDAARALLTELIGAHGESREIPRDRPVAAANTAHNGV